MIRISMSAIALLIAVTTFPVSPVIAATPQPVTSAEGVLRLKSANSFDDTILRLKADVAAKGVRLFDQIDQSGLGAQADLKIGRSTLVIFGNPPLGVQFLQSNPYVGLDWPVRMLVTQDMDGTVWVAWTDFDVIAKRYRIVDKSAQFKMAGEVANSIATAATAN